MTEAQHKEGPISICIKVIWEFEFQLEVLETAHVYVVEVLRFKIIKFNQTVSNSESLKLKGYLVSLADKIRAYIFHFVRVSVSIYFLSLNNFCRCSHNGKHGIQI